MLLLWLLYLHRVLLSLFVIVGNMRLLSSCDIASSSILLMHNHVIVGELLLHWQLKVVLTHDYLLLAATWCPQVLRCRSARSSSIPRATLPDPSLLLLAGLSIHALRHQFLQVWTLLSLDMQGLLSSTAGASIPGLVSTASLVRCSSRLLLLTGYVGLLNICNWFGHVIGCLG